MFPNRVQLLGAANNQSSSSGGGGGGGSGGGSGSSSPVGQVLGQAQMVEVVAPQSPASSISRPLPHPSSSTRSAAALAPAALGPGSLRGVHQDECGAPGGGCVEVQRRCHNARDLGDLVQLLADPTETGILAHLANAGRFLSYRPRVSARPLHCCATTCRACVRACLPAHVSTRVCARTCAK